WLKNFNSRLAIDYAMTDKLKYGNKAIQASVVRKTWKKVLKNERSLARYWHKVEGVLVGV
ncbi:hypothetical protein C8J57DRAFT_950822, partial [Mycena rebaudengoi]